jgi:rhodanese-related sulfurtransferase
MRRIETDELKRMLDADQDVVLVNVLDAKSFDREHIPRSHHVPASNPDLVGQIKKLAGDKNRSVVVYCSNPQCPASRGAGRKLDDAGLANVLHYAGGSHPPAPGSPLRLGRATAHAGSGRPGRAHRQPGDEYHHERRGRAQVHPLSHAP